MTSVKMPLLSALSEEAGHGAREEQLQLVGTPSLVFAGDTLSDQMGWRFDFLRSLAL